MEAVGQSEADRLRLKAQAYKQYGDAAVMAMVLESLPQVPLLSTRKLICSSQIYLTVAK